MFLPCIDSGFEWAIGVAGKDDVFFGLGVKSFVRENVLEINGFSWVPVGVPPSARVAAFRISEVVFRYLKLSFGRRLLTVDLVLDDEGPGDTLILFKQGLGNGEKFTLLGVGLGVGGMFILTKSSLASSRVLEGICKARFCRLHGWPGGFSSIISVEFPPCEKKRNKKYCLGSAKKKNYAFHTNHAWSSTSYAKISDN